MSSEFRLAVITPEGAIFDETVTSVSVPGQEGSFGVLDKHAPIVAKLTGGVVRVRQQDQEKFFAVGPGILEVTQPTKCLLLVDYARRAADMDEARDQVH